MAYSKFSNYSVKKVPEELYEINDENILMEFSLDDEVYYVLGDFPNDMDVIYFAKMDFDEKGNEVLKGIEDDKYEKVVSYYEQITNEMEDSEDYV